MDPTQHADGPLHAEHAALLRWTAVAMIAGGAIMVLFELGRVLTGDSSAYSRAAGIVVALGQLGIAAGCAGLWLHHSFGGSVLARTGLALAMVGLVLYATGNAVEPFAPTVWWPFAAATLLIPLGFILAGVAAVRAHVWDGWARYLPLAVGVYPVLAVYPWLAMTGAADGSWIGTTVVAVWGLLFAVTGWVELAHVEHRTTAAAHARADARRGRGRRHP
ncbi:hypothetical protein [Sinomonas mesophila]|uniref:hypothetical protein n=1 Tax=Sinomonas mesophila TaxID=1531955 RepID=UPI000986C3EB|nr:hypothetical protein [Sinomonas mesophila]